LIGAAIRGFVPGGCDGGLRVMGGLPNDVRHPSSLCALGGCVPGGGVCVV
jgi:hypothetical protein